MRIRKGSVTLSGFVLILFSCPYLLLRSSCNIQEFLPSPRSKSDEHQQHLTKQTGNLSTFQFVYPKIPEHLAWKRGNLSISQLQSPSLKIPEECQEAVDTADGWPITPLGQCGDSFFFKFEQHVTVPRKNRRVNKMPECKGAELQMVDTLACEVGDFNHPAHFITQFLPCWSSWLESSSGGSEKTKLTLVPANPRDRAKATVSSFVRAMMDAFECTEEINVKDQRVSEPNNTCAQLVKIDGQGSGWHFATNE